MTFIFYDFLWINIQGVFYLGLKSVYGMCLLEILLSVFIERRGKMYSSITDVTVFTLWSSVYSSLTSIASELYYTLRSVTSSSFLMSHISCDDQIWNICCKFSLEWDKAEIRQRFDYSRTINKEARPLIWVNVSVWWNYPAKED